MMRKSNFSKLLLYIIMQNNLKNLPNVKLPNLRTLPNIPKYRVNEIIKLYEAVKHTLGSESRIRRRTFISILRVYYKWEKPITIQLMFDKYVKPLDIEYMTQFRAKNIKKEYGDLVKQLFGSIDNNDDGCIDLEEFRYALRKVEDIIPDDLFNKADTNNDGVLDTNEFYKLVASTPELRNNFDLIMKSAVNENERKEYERRSRIFRNDVTNRRPSLYDIRRPNDICAMDVPLYGVELPGFASETTRLRYGL